uniref:Copia protein n=1 Tax=Sipha flava TaxID=143950 RepID=A0A2S2R071_9HEMI
MSSSKMAEISIPVFDGVDYAHWKKRIMMFLKLKKCATVIERTKISTDKEDVWAENDLKAINYIYSAISNKQLEFINNLETAYEIIKKFDEMYLKESTALQIIFRNKLEKIRLNDFRESSVFISDFEKSVNELKAAGATITEKEKLHYLLRTLPESYSYIGDLIDTLKPEDQTVSYVIDKIKMIEIKNKINDNSNVKSNAFVSESKNHRRQQEKSCFGCGEIGHFKKDCPNVNNASFGYRAQRGGHQQFCGNGLQRGASHSRGRSRGSSGRSRGRGGTWQQDSSSFGAFTAKIVESTVMYTEMKDKHIDWLLDSGCTDHVVNRNDVFVNSIELKNPVNVNVGDGRALKATRVGQISSYFKVFDKYVRIDMSNVFYVKDMTANLLSLSKITVKNKVVAQNNTAKIYNSNSVLLAIAYKVDKLYKMRSEIRNNDKVTVNSMSTEINKNKMTLKEKWHRTLGHVNFKYLNILCKNELAIGLPKEIENDYMKCAVCIENKMHNLTFENNREKAKEILGIVHTDVNGPQNTVGLNGEKYFVC